MFHEIDLKNMRDKIDLLNDYDKEAFNFIIEEFNDRIERRIYLSKNKHI